MKDDCMQAVMRVQQSIKEAKMGYYGASSKALAAGTANTPKCDLDSIWACRVKMEHTCYQCSKAVLNKIWCNTDTLTT